MLKLWDEKDATTPPIREQVELPFLRHIEVIPKEARGPQCFVQEMGLYHVTIFNSIWTDTHMYEYFSDVIERRKSNVTVVERKRYSFSTL